MSENPEKRCGLCGHVMDFATCGAAAAWTPDGGTIDLCHGDCTGLGPMTCYHRYTTYGERP